MVTVGRNISNPASNHQPNYTSPSTRTTELVLIHITMIMLASLVVGLRLICRYVVLNNPGWDDYLIIVAMVNGCDGTLSS